VYKKQSKKQVSKNRRITRRAIYSNRPFEGFDWLEQINWIAISIALVVVWLI
jgi:hypothetical protein